MRPANLKFILIHDYDFYKSNFTMGWRKYISLSEIQGKYYCIDICNFHNVRIYTDHKKPVYKLDKRHIYKFRNNIFIK